MLPGASPGIILVEGDYLRGCPKPAGFYRRASRGIAGPSRAHVCREHLLLPATFPSESQGAKEKISLIT